jgi:hypothetical protein
MRSGGRRGVAAHELAPSRAPRWDGGFGRRGDAAQQAIERIGDLACRRAAGEPVFGCRRQRCRFAADSGEAINAAGAGERLGDRVDAIKNGVRRGMRQTAPAGREHLRIVGQPRQKNLARARQGAFERNVAAQIVGKRKRVERLGDNAGRTKRLPARTILRLRTRRQKHDRNGRRSPVGAHFREHGRTVHPGHFHVEQHEIGTPLARDAQRLGAGRAIAQREKRILLKRQRDHGADVGIAIREQDMQADYADYSTTAASTRC